MSEDSSDLQACCKSDGEVDKVLCLGELKIFAIMEQTGNGRSSLEVWTIRLS